MRADDIKSLLQATPFRPINIVMASEKTFHIPHPDFAFLNPTGQVLIVAHADTSAVDILDVPLIARIEVPEKPAKKR